MWQAGCLAGLSQLRVMISKAMVAMRTLAGILTRKLPLKRKIPHLGLLSPHTMIMMLPLFLTSLSCPPGSYWYTCLGTVPSTVDCAFQYLPLMKKTPCRHGYRPVLWRKVLNWRFLFPPDLILCQVDKKKITCTSLIYTLNSFAIVNPYSGEINLVV